MMIPRWMMRAALLLALPLGASSLAAQGVTTGAIAGRVVDAAGNPRAGVRVVAVHVPSGTRYEARTRADGAVSIPGMRVGGPYTVTATAIGLQPTEHKDVFVALGTATDLAFTMQESAVMLQAVEITGTPEGEMVFSSARTGAATALGRDAVERMPTLTGRIADLVRLTPQASGNSFVGQDNRLNNMTVDGAYFNNSFGLAGQPGDRTNVAPISLAAIEQVLVNVAPYDIRQGHFVGAGVNTVTRSGTNDFRGSLYMGYRDQGGTLHGRAAGSGRVDPGEFENRKLGFTLGGPIKRDQSFFFVSYEGEGFKQPGTTFRANKGGETVGGNITRVQESDLTTLSNFLLTNFNYETGGWEGYSHDTPQTRVLTRVDHNVNDRNKLSLRYVLLNSESDILMSNSGSLGGPANPANRRTNTNALNFQNSNYKMTENIRSLVGEWNAILGENWSNSTILGFSSHDESRKPVGQFFPMVDINQGGILYTSFGFEPFTPNNELRYKSLQFQNNVTRHLVNHDVTFGLSVERYESENVFFPGSQSVYVYNSLADFYTDANDHLANPNRTTSPVTLRRFQYRYSNIPGQDKPIQPLEVLYTGVYGQDQWRINPDLRLTFGLRMDVPMFKATGYANANADLLTFRDEKGNPVQYKSGELPKANPLFSPRVGFNWDPTSDRSTQVRGGTGVFSGPPAYVWISNQVGNTGMLTGFEQIDNTTTRPFHPDPHHYKPANITGDPAFAYGLELVDNDFKFPQLWRTNIGVDRRMPWGLIATADFIYNRDLNGIYYIDANLPAAQSQFGLAADNGTGKSADNRPRWVGLTCTGTGALGTAGRTTNNPCVNRINNAANNEVSRAVVLKNQSIGRSWNAAFSLEKPFAAGTYVKAAYSYGEAKNTVDPGSIATGSFTGNAMSGDPNNPGLGFSFNSPGHRLFGAASYRREYMRMGATTVTLYWEGRTAGNASYTFAGDANGDGAANDLIYIPRDASEMNFVQYTQAASGSTPARTFTVAEQEAAWEAFILQDPYLSKNRGGYAQRGAVFMPMVRRADLNIAQEIFSNFGGKRNSLELRADFLNFSNMLNKNWGVSPRFVTTQPLTNPGADAQGRMTYRLRNTIKPAAGGGTEFRLLEESFEKSASLFDVYRVLIGVRYNFQ